MYMYIRGRGSGCALGLQLPCSRSSSGISDGQGGCEKWKIFGKIILHDGSVPQIEMECRTIRNGRKMKDIIEASITGLESAVWFKVLVFDTVCLDLETKCIHWTSCNITECTERRQSHQPYCSCKHSHEWYLEQQKDNMTAGRDLEKGLEIARSILNGSNDNEHQDVLLLLHVYILPIIRLHASDRKHVSSALEDQIQVLFDLDSAIDKMTSERQDIKKTMKDWRQDICRELKDERAIANCNVQFLKLLYQHLQNDLKNAYVELDSCQERVDECKGSLMKKKGSQYITDLVEARKSRDRVADYINKALFVMEEVNLILSVTTIPENNELTDQHRAYIRIQEECKRHSKELHDLQRKKLLATSVREALKSTESELKKGRETTGIDITSDGLVRSTDVLEPVKLPDAWQTLPSKVSEALEKNKTLNDLHHNFSVSVVNQCREEIKGQPTIRRLRPKLDVSTSWKKLKKQHSGAGSPNNHQDGEKMRKSARNSIKERRPATHYQAVTQALKNDVNKHFHEVTSVLASHLNLPYAYSRADLWTCYERAFYPGKISELLKLYVYAYEKETGHLQNILPSSNLQDMNLDDEWILNILGLYAPFNIHEDIEIGQDASNHVVEIEKQPAELGTMVKDVASVSGLGSAVRHRLKIDDDIRERLESGVDVDLPNERLRHRNVSGHQKGESRQSWRNTQIIDCNWVTVPINIDAQSVPCLVEKQMRDKSVKLRDHEVASRHASLPEIKLLKQYSHHTLSLTDIDKPHAALKKEVSHREDHIGDDSGVFNDHHDDDRLSQKGDLNSNVLGRMESSRTAGSSKSDVSQPLRESDLCGSTASVDAAIMPQLALSSDTASDVEKMSITSSSHDPVNDIDTTVMIQGVDGEIKLDRELSRRCREKPAIAEFLKRFSQAYHCFRVVLEESVPTSKLQWLLKCLKEVNAVAEKQASLITCGKQRMLSGDDLLTSLILFLIHGDPGEVTAFYPQLKFLEDFLPDFLDKGEIGFAVIQFESAYSYILRIEKNKREH